MKLPSSVTKLLSAACTDRTWSQYSSCFRKWSVYCNLNQIDCWNPNIEQVLSFLAGLYEDELSYASINTARSALSTILGPIDGCKIGDHNLVTRLLKGVGKLRPPLPRYSSTWDVNRVLDLFLIWPENSDLSLKQLSLKLVALLALTTAQRVQTLVAILISQIVWSEPLEIIITAQLKTTSITRPNKPLSLPSYLPNDRLCVVKTLRTYIEKTRNLRTSDQLLVSFTPPHKKITSQTVSRWLTNVLNLAGIDDRVFKGHSYRHASTSFAKAKGVSIDVILRQAGWSDKSKVFAKFYDRPIVRNTSFVTAVLSTNTK